MYYVSLALGCAITASSEVKKPSVSELGSRGDMAFSKREYKEAVSFYSQMIKADRAASNNERNYFKVPSPLSPYPTSL